MKIISEGQNRKNKLIISIIVIIALLILISYALFLSVPVISDETTTMANAAWLTGYDWSWMIASLGGYYYRFGQSILTVPFFAFLKNPNLIYKLSMILQAVIQSSIIIIVYIICKRHLNVKSSKIAVLLGCTVCFVPSMVLYVYYYRGDYLLGVLPWYTLLAFLETVRSDSERKKGKRIIWTIIAISCAIFSYSAHTRGIVAVIALFITTILTKIFLKRKSLHWPTLIGIAILLLIADSMAGNVLKRALYSIGGLNANTLETVNISSYFSIFSATTWKDLFMICLSWLHTLIISTQGLIWVGGATGIIILIRSIGSARIRVTDNEKIVILFSLLIFIGYYAIGALFFKGTYHALCAGELERRVDRLLYDRYAICGAGMMAFIALYVLCVRYDCISKKSKIICALSTFFIFSVWEKKILPLAVKYTGYIYNTIILNTFQKINKPSQILSGQEYSKKGLILISICGIGLLIIILLLSEMKRKCMPYVLLILVLVTDVFFIQTNFVKIRKASNDYVVEATESIVDFMKKFENEVTDEFPYILKGGLSGVKIQFYQSQLMSYKMFGKNQEDILQATDYFIISKHGDVDMTWYKNDYYMFEDFDYQRAKYDIVYVKGKKLKNKMEQLGYKMTNYIP